MLTLATVAGAQVAPVFAGPRFVSRGGTIIDFTQQHASITLEEAEEGLALYRRDADDCTGRFRRQYLTWAAELEAAIADAKRWRRGGRWFGPGSAA